MSDIFIGIVKDSGLDKEGVKYSKFELACNISQLVKIFLHVL